MQDAEKTMVGCFKALNVGVGFYTAIKDSEWLDVTCGHAEELKQHVRGTELWEQAPSELALASPLWR